jgi:hypothetical protein
LDEQVSLKAVFNQILAYQFIIILSRAVGFLRDYLIILFVGLGALSDQVFFLLSYADVLMTLFLGGGSALFVSLAMAKHSGSSDTLGSGVVFYLLLGIALVGIEISSGASFGDTLFSGLKSNSDFQADYFISLIMLCFVLPTGIFNGVFLFYDKLYLQPLMNLFFSILIVLGLIGLFNVTVITTQSVVIVLVFAACVRFFVSLFVSLHLHRINWKLLGFVNEISFYKNLFVSGLSVGLIFIIPFVFRGELPRYVDGGYALAAVAFKVSDLIVALLIIPIASLLLKRNALPFGFGLLATFFTALVTSLLACWAIEHIPAIYNLKVEEFDIVRFSLLSGIVTMPSVFVTLYFVNISRSNVSVVAGFLVLLAVLFLGDRFQQLSFYYYYLYAMFVIFIVIHLIYYKYWFDETTSNG